MSSQTSVFLQLMGEVLANLGLAEATPNSDGVYTLSVDDKVDVYIWCPDEENVFLFSSLGRLPEGDEGEDGNAPSTAEYLLRLNAMRTRCLPVTWLTEEGNIVLWLKESVQILNQSRLTQILNDFMDHALHTYAVLHEEHAEAVNGENSEPSEDVKAMHHAMKA